MACFAAVAMYINVLCTLFLTCKVLNVSSVQDGALTLSNLLLSLYAAPQMICTVKESALRSEPV